MSRTKIDESKNASEFIIKHAEIYNVIYMMYNMGMGISVKFNCIYATDAENFSENFYRASRALNHNRRFMKRPMIQRMIREIEEFHIFNFQKSF